MMKKGFSGSVTIFHGQSLPEEGTLAGYAALIDAFELAVPLPNRMCAVGKRHRRMEKDGWRFFTPRHMPSPDLKGHLEFALKYEGVDLCVLFRLFEKIEKREIEALVRDTPTGAYARRIWFFYEWLTGERLNLPDMGFGTYVPALDPKRQFTVPGIRVRRQRVVDNLPGTRLFCPLVFRTPALDSYTDMDLKAKAREVLEKVPGDIVSRTAAFLLLKDTRASFAIEGEALPQRRAERWGRIVREAGKAPLTAGELERLQGIVIGDGRFAAPGFRTEGVFVGEHDRETGMPIPEHVGARPEDISSIIEGLVAFDRRTEGKLDPVVAAAALAFGFTYIHPFSNGNGRIHRYLFHHVLAGSGFNPLGMIFPVSAAILDRLDEYRKVLQSHSEKLLQLIEWEETGNHNVRVVNRTDDYYRFFDATAHAEFLFSCINRILEKDLPEETSFLANYDRFKSQVEEIVDMPSKSVNLLFRFLESNGGRLSIRALTEEFKALTAHEVSRLEALYRELFGTSRKNGPFRSPP